MALGNEMGSFTLSGTSITYSPGSAGIENASINMEGSIEGSGASGAILGTMDVAPSEDAKFATYIPGPAVNSWRTATPASSPAVPSKATWILRRGP
jgi:hypothetical protein